MERRNITDSPMEIYIHIPFCIKKCDYCDFLSDTMSGVTTTRNLILRKHGQKFRHRNLATLWSEYSKTDSNQINMDLFVAQPPINHSLTLKPLDYENNCSYTTVINLLSKDF